METAPGQSVLVTGASGFIGRRLVCRLAERHCRVSCLVRADSRVDELRSVGATLLMGDVTDRPSVDRALAESQAGTVFHLAGLVKALRTEDFMRVNAGGVDTVAAACAHRAGPPVLVVVSSVAAAGPSAADRPLVETDAPAPVSKYGRSKLAGEQAAAAFADVLPITIVRPSIVFGPGDPTVFEMFRPIARWGLHVVPGRHDHRYSLIHADDLVGGLLLAAEKGERMRPGGPRGQGVYFIAGEDHPTYTQFGQAIAEALGRRPPAVVRLPGPLVSLVGYGSDMIARARRRPGLVSGDKMSEALAGSWMCSSAKGRTHLGWNPAATMPDRLRETARWYRQAGWI